MYFTIRHTTTYDYSIPVHLGPQILRLTPRCDGNQRLLTHDCVVSPKPSLQSRAVDAEGNTVTRLWFIGETSELRIVSTSRVETLLDNPYDYIVDAPANILPMPYGECELPLLAPYRYPGAPSPPVIQLALRLARQTGRDTLAFLEALNTTLHSDFKREIRPEGPPRLPEITLRRGGGACRDLAILFIVVCRIEGIAARFVSGYQARAETAGKHRQLHAWPEVYIPGGGWRGYDPGHGKPVAAAHIATAASATAAGAAPVEGTFYGNGATSNMDFELDITAVD